MANIELRPALALLLVGAFTGYLLGRLTTTPSSTSAPSNPKPLSQLAKDLSNPSDSDSNSEESEESEDDAPAGELSTFPHTRDDLKLVLVVRTDLGMTKGKIAAQCGHATLACYKSLLSVSSPLLARWERSGQAKIAVQVKSEEELLVLQAQAMSLGLCARVIHDAGRTQIASGSATVLGIGPGPRGVIDGVTGGLKLL